MERIRKNDEVIIIAGKDKGRKGKVIKVIREKLRVTRVLVEGMNRVKKHVKPNPQKGQQGGIVEKELPIHVSNVALYNTATGKAGRIGFRFLEDGRKVRYFKSDNEVIDRADR